jgi:hypothetical protein
MNITMLKEYCQWWLKNHKFPWNINARQLQELYRNMLRTPDKWSLPANFGKTPNTDFKTVWVTLNRVRFNGCPYDPRNVFAGWKNLPTHWLVEMMVHSHSPLAVANMVLPNFLKNNKEAHEWLTWVSSNAATNQWQNPSRGRMLGLLGNDIGFTPRGMRMFSPVAWLMKTKTNIVNFPNFVDRKIADWVVAKHESVLFNKVQEWYDNGVMTMILATVLDEIRVGDLSQGIRTSPEKVIDAIRSRRGTVYRESVLASNATYPDFPTHWPTPPKNVIHIRTSSELVKEGDAMVHCVTGYHDRIIKRTSYIVRIATTQGRSTAEIWPTTARGEFAKVTQHRGHHNQTAPDANHKLLMNWLNTPALNL